MHTEQAKQVVSIQAAFIMALEHHRAGRVSQAEFIYHQILRLEPNHSDALHLLGVMAHQAGKNEIAVDLICKAINSNPAIPVFFCNLGVVYKDQGKFEQAISAFQKALAIDPNFAFAHFSKGVVHKELKALKDAIASYRKAVLLKPDYAEAHYNLGVACDEQGNFAEAMSSYNEAISCKPDFVQAHFSAGLVHQRQGKLKEAVASYRKAIFYKPDFVEAHSNLGFILNEQGELDEAVASYNKAISFQRELPKIYTNLGIVLVAQGRLEEAKALYRKAISLNPNLVEAHYNMGSVLNHLGDWDEAKASYLRSLFLKPDYADACYEIGLMLYKQCRPEEAMIFYHKALSINPDHAATRWALAIAHMPIIHTLKQDPQTCREAFSKQLDRLDSWFRTERITDGYRAVGAALFNLPYQEVDNRSLIEHFGALCNRLMQDWQIRQGYQPALLKANGKIKIGIVTHHINDHSVWHALIKGWVNHLDKSQFEVHVIYLGNVQDLETSIAKSLATSFIEGQRSLASWTETILAQHLEIIIYPEIGMEPTTFKLANLRLAPVQITAWGHPETSGLQTIDYFLSATDFEPDAAEDNYTERLIKLPNLGCYYTQFSIARDNPDFNVLGIDRFSPLLLCPGTPFKYAPQYDWIFPEIARKLGKCKLVFFTHHVIEMSEVLKKRLQFAFSNAGLGFDDYVVFIPWQPRSIFYGLMERADVYLDTIGFSGFNTAMQAIECALPIVTREGRFMRGRFASGILKRMGLPELVVDSEEAYIILVVRLVQDKKFRQYIVDHIKQSRDILFDDRETIRTLEDKLISISRP